MVPAFMTDDATSRIFGLLHRGTGYVAGPAGPDADLLSRLLRQNPDSFKELLQFVEQLEPVASDHARTFLRNWFELFNELKQLSNKDLAEFRAALEYEKTVGGEFLSPNILKALLAERAKGIEYPPLSFLSAVDEGITAEFARRTSLGARIPTAKPWPVPTSSAAELCACAQIVEGGDIAGLKWMLCEEASTFNAKAHYDEVYAVIGRAWVHNIERVRKLSDADFEALREAVEALEVGHIPCRRPDSILALMSAAIQAELPRRQWKVFVACMLARERYHHGKAKPAADHKGRLAEGVATTPSGPLKAVGEAVLRG